MTDLYRNNGKVKKYGIPSTKVELHCYDGTGLTSILQQQGRDLVELETTYHQI
jgi:hypothetical protein